MSSCHAVNDAVMESVEEFQSLMSSPEAIRCVALLGDFGHGKTTLRQHLESAAAPVKPSREAVLVDFPALEAENADTRRECTDWETTERLSVSTLLVGGEGARDVDSPGRSTLVYLLDTPGLADFAAEVASTLRLVDGCVLVVDACYGLPAHGERLLREALHNRVCPVLFVNGIDRLLCDPTVDPECIEARLRALVERVNEVIRSQPDELLPNCEVSPAAGNVLFGCARGGWAFSLPGLARGLRHKVSTDNVDAAEWLWEPSAKVTNVRSKASCEVQSNLCSFVLSPLAIAARAMMAGDLAAGAHAFEALGIAVLDVDLAGHALLDHVLARWAGNLAEILLDLIRKRLPDPLAAQIYREDGLLRARADDTAAEAMRDCDATGPTLVSITRLMVGKRTAADVEAASQRDIYALGRVFSGTLKSSVPVMTHTRMAKSASCTLQALLVPLRPDFLEEFACGGGVPCGNLVFVRGIGNQEFKEATLTDRACVTPLLDLRVSALARDVFRMVVRTVEDEALPHLRRALKLLHKVDPLARCAFEEWGDYTLTGGGERHLGACLRFLRAEMVPHLLMASAPPLDASSAAARCGVSLRETVRERGEAVYVEAAEGGVSFTVAAEPLDRGLCSALELDFLDGCDSHADRARCLSDLFGWHVDERLFVWSVGPGETGPNVVLDFAPSDERAGASTGSPAAQPSVDALACVEAACQWATKCGGLCEEPLRGIIFSLRSACNGEVLHGASARHVVGAAKRCLHAAQLSAGAVLQEPVLRVQLICPLDEVARVNAILDSRGAKHLQEEHLPWVGEVMLLAQLRAALTLGLIEALGAAVRVQLYFASWEDVPGDPKDPCFHQDLVLSLRRWRNLLRSGEGLPTVAGTLAMPSFAERLGGPSDEF